MRCALLLAILFRSSHARTLQLSSDDAVLAAKRKHEWLLVMLQAEWDHGSQMAAASFKRAAKAWSGPGNVTFGLTTIEKAPQLARQLDVTLERLPGYGLFAHGVDRPVPHRGGWSEGALGAWLHAQRALQPTTVASLAELSALATEDSHGLVALGLLTSGQRKRRLLDQAARAAGVQVAVALGDERLAEELGDPDLGVGVWTEPIRRAHREVRHWSYVELSVL